MLIADTSVAVPKLMRAAVYRGRGSIAVETVPTPQAGPGELLVRVESCGVCHTDLKKVEHDLLPPPRIFGHEMAGVVAAVGEGVRTFQPGQPVVAFHHSPCSDCFYCRRRLYAQCATYKRVGITAGFEPAGGGFSEYVRVMDWIVRRGVIPVPDGVPLDRACFVEPVNTCLKAVRQLALEPGELVVVLGQGPIGLIFTMLARRAGAVVVATDMIARRRELAARMGAAAAWDPRDTDIVKEVASMTGGRGGDVVIVAVSAPGITGQAIACSRPGSRILLFSQTSHRERIEMSGADICVGERLVLGSYSASVDLQEESARLVFSGELPLEDLISHRFPLDRIREGIDIALHPDEQSLKIVIQPQRRTS
ncbi:MAG: alcohol dehydrogenase catalytic domain-containing protein [Bryobacterales bacterium]|nr:alcohol dehydrogenase catalytic domain-containing protein [Bryobacterales bacterium]